MIRLFVVLALLSSCGTPTIKQKDVERILKVLSADSLEGRKSFTTGIDKAALFLQSEFFRIGLKPLDTLKSFYQTFTVYSPVQIKTVIVLDGKTMKEDQGFVLSPFRHSIWTERSAIRRCNVNTENDLRESFDLLDNEENIILFIHPKFSSAFNGIRRYFVRNSNFPTLDAGSIKIVVLTDEVPKNFQIIDERSFFEKKLANIVGQIPGRRVEERVLFSAHYDHLGIIKTIDGDSIANGADDDASGTTAVVVLADYFAQGGMPERTLVFSLFTAEEIGGYGSQYFSTHTDPEKIVAMFNIEMIGKTSRFGRAKTYITGFDRSDFGKILQSQIDSTFYPDPYIDENLFYRSDNATLARLGVPAHSISTSQMDRDSLYHSVDDEIESLDLDQMTQVIRSLARGAESIISGKATPTRITPTDR